MCTTGISSNYIFLGAPASRPPSLPGDGGAREAAKAGLGGGLCRLVTIALFLVFSSDEHELMMMMMMMTYDCLCDVSLLRTCIHVCLYVHI